MSIAEHKADDARRLAETRNFHVDSKEARAWCDRMSKPLRAAEKFRGLSPRSGEPDTRVFKT